MKILILIHVLLLLLLTFCKTSSDPISRFIPGTYIRFSQHEFGTEYDTLVISFQNKTVHEYQILRKWKYERILDGKVIEPEYKKHFTTAVYDSETKLLRETETGKTYSFDKQNKLLFNGTIKYKKL